MTRASRRPQKIAVAAGIILFRRRSRKIEFLLLRNARHRSWGFPKGHAEDGEDALATARRETREETGIRVVKLVAGFDATIEYPIRSARGSKQKRVTYLLGATSEAAVLSDEHDRMEWATATRARELLTHLNLRRVFDAAVEALLKDDRAT